MKSTGVGQNRQYPSTYAPLGTPSHHTRDSNRNPPRHQRNNNSGMTNEYQTTTNGRSSRPNRNNYQNGDRDQSRQRPPFNNQTNSVTADFQPRQIQKSADMESEYSRLHRQNEMTHFVEDPNNPLSSTDMATAAENQIGAVNKQELPILSLKNSLSKISFCDRECFNVNDNPTKEAILKYIETKYRGLNIIDNQYVLMKPHMLKNITYHEHILTTFTNGNPYLLFLTLLS